jgi:hypothetical protein
MTEAELISACILEINEQIRYYFGKKRTVKSVSNLNGFYTGIEGSYTIRKSNNIDFPSFYNYSQIFNNSNTETNFLGAVFGYQVQTNQKSYIRYWSNFW